MGIWAQGKYLLDSNDATNINIDNKTIVKVDNILQVGQISWQQVLGITAEFVNYTNFYSELELKLNKNDGVLKNSLASNSFNWLNDVVTVKTQGNGGVLLDSVNGLKADGTKLSFITTGITQLNNSQQNIRKADGKPWTSSTNGVLATTATNDIDLTTLKDVKTQIANYVRQPVRTGQISLTNRYSAEQPALTGNRLYGNLYDSINELNDPTKEIHIKFDDTQAPILIVNNNADQNGYIINHDNIDTTLIISRGNSAAYAEGRITNQFTGNYTKNGQPYKWYNISLNCEVINAAVGQDYIEFYGSGIGRDRNVFAILPNDKGPTTITPTPKVYNYQVFNKA